MHNATRVVSVRRNGTLEYFVTCSSCAERGRGRVVTIGDVEYAGLIFGPVSERTAAALIESHRDASVAYHD